MRLLLEGPAIEPLLERVRTEHGPHARIVHAERVRTGGVGGFFAKEHFEVTVEVDPAVAAPAPDGAVPAPAAAPAGAAGGAPPAPSGIDALVAAAEALERDEQPAACSADVSTPAPASARVPARRPSRETLVPSHSARTAPPVPAQPLVPAALAANAEPAPAPWVFPKVAARTVTLDALAPLAAGPVPAPEPVEDVPSGDVGGPSGAVAGPHRPVSTESTAFADLLARLQLENARPLPLPDDLVVAGGDGEEPGVPEAVRAGAEVPAAPVAATVLAAAVPVAAAVPAAAAVPVAAAVTVAAAVPVTAARRGRRAARSSESTSTAARLAATGLPAALAEEVLAGTDGEPAAVVARLLPVLAGLPVPAPDLSRAGTVVLVVGEPARAAEAAAALAGRHRLGADAVVDLGATGAAPTADHVRRELARLRGGATAAVVVVGVDAVADPSHDPWFAAVAGTLAADHVVACVDATRKVSDVARWLAALEGAGLAVSALDVHRAGATGDPAAVLGLGVPVLALDGARADAAAWTALVLPRLLGQEAGR